MLIHKKSKNKLGFTLLELLIVIAIIGILGMVLFFLINPAETLRKARDSQRISDLGTIKSALALYTSNVSSPQLDGTSGTANAKCKDGSGTKTIFLSVATSGIATTTGMSPAYSAFTTSTLASSSLTNGTGWVPVNLASISGGTPISQLPVDPTNTTNSSVATSSLIYRYVCNGSPLGFGVSAQMESAYYTGSDSSASSTDVRKIDGGNNADLYEVGSDPTLLPATGAKY